MSIYTKNKTTVSNLKKAEDFEIDDNSFKVGIKSGAENIIIDYLTNLYSNPATAVCRELFTNASDASDDDLPVYIEIKEEEVEEGQAKTYSFSITDYGCGMSAEELKNNYITYANSSKVDDYNSVGSFGLGSKSPMALVSKYTVESFNGKEQNIATVARTDNGIFANIEKVNEVSDHSFTRVSFGGISRDTANKMHLYIRENICRFSKQPVHFKSCFEDEVEFLECYSISDNISVYSNNIKEALIKYSCGSGKAEDSFKILARINNIVYNVNYLRYSNDDYIVIDVEPGYFSFAPSREELPYGKEKDHIIEIANDKLFNSYYDFVKYSTEKGIFECDDIFNYLFIRGMLKDINNFDCFCGASKSQLKLYKDMVDIDNGNYELDEDSIKFYTIRSKETNKYNFKFLDDKKLMQVSFNEFIKRLKESVSLTPYIDKSGKFSLKLKEKWHLNRVTIVKNSKFTRKNEVIIPREYKVSNASKSVKSEFNKIYDRADSYGHDKFGWYFVYLKGSTKLPKSVLEYINKFCFGLNPDKDSDIHYIENNVEVVEYPKQNEVESGTKTKATPVNDRKDYFELFDSCCVETRIHTNYGGEQLVKSLKNGYKYFVYDSNSPTTPFLRLFAELYETGLIKIHDKTKMVKKYLNGLGLEELTIDEYTIEKIKQDVKDKFIDGEYVASFIHFYKYNGRAEFSCLRSDLDVTNYPSTYLAIALNNDICGCKSIAEFFNVDKKVCKSAVKSCAGMYKFGRTSAAENNYTTNQAVLNLLRKNINKRKAWNSYGEALTKLAIHKKYNSTIRDLKLFLNKNVDLSSVESTKSEELLSDILADRINDEMSNIGFDKLDGAVKEFSKFKKYISIYSLLDGNDEVDSFVKSKMDEKADVIVEEFNKLDI